MVTGIRQIYLPDTKVLMAVDAFSPGSVPSMGLDLTMNMDQCLKVFDKFLAKDFDVMVPGHHSNAANRDDVNIAKDYVMDVYDTITDIYRGDHRPLIARAMEKYDQCAKAIIRRWTGRLNNVDVWAPSHCRAGLVYVEWDVGVR